MAVRQRKPLVVPEEADHPIFDRPLFQRFRKLDIYARTADDAQRRSALGGAISLFAVVVILLLMLHETYHYIVGTDAYFDQLAVDVGVGSKVPVNINITFPATQCQDLSLDVVDATGVHENNVRTDLFKAPVDFQGRLAFKGRYRSVPFTKNGHRVILAPEDDPSSPSFCGKCYIEPHGRRYWMERIQGSLQTRLDKANATQCCNNCDDVMGIYDKYSLTRPPEEDVEQCLHRLFMRNPGCNIRGTLHVQKVRGNFHFVPGAALDAEGRVGASGPHVHVFNPNAILRFNPSHKILHFSFGDALVQRIHKRGVVYPLDGTSFHHPQGGQSVIKYFVKVVPTTYQQGSGKVERSYEYSVTQHSKVYVGSMLSSSTGLFFSYDFHPIKIAHKFRRMPFLHFLVRLSGLVGGLFVVTGMLDATVLWALAVRRRLQTPLHSGGFDAPPDPR